GSDNVHEREYATVEVLHPPRGEAGYGYLILPHADEAATRERAAEPGVTVVANTAAVQACRIGELLAANFRQPDSVDHITVDKPACVLVHRADDEALVSVSDPTQRATTLTIELRGAFHPRIEGEGVTMSRRGPVTTVEVYVAGRGGVPVRFRLYRH